jgi:hypothetical protein
MLPGIIAQICRQSAVKTLINHKPPARTIFIAPGPAIPPAKTLALTFLFLNPAANAQFGSANQKFICILIIMKVLQKTPAFIAKKLNKTPAPSSILAERERSYRSCFGFSSVCSSI